MAARATTSRTAKRAMISSMATTATTRSTAAKATMSSPTMATTTSFKTATMMARTVITTDKTGTTTARTETTTVRMGTTTARTEIDPSSVTQDVASFSDFRSSHSFGSLFSAPDERDTGRAARHDAVWQRRSGQFSWQQIRRRAGRRRGQRRADRQQRTRSCRAGLLDSSRPARRVPHLLPRRGPCRRL